ncbi:MAG: T9SS type A sorting domain-containing protein, partial [Candidatus Kapabacteria bacterium]|nr:T9SS type A sorting domain-containing protein [Candidatus Kapabacteria bacterium]
SRYFLFGLYDPLNSSTSYYYIYDRQSREIIWQKTLYEHESLRYQFFNTSNKIAFAEEVQLPEDDKVYSYIRIFDPDTRTIVKDIKLSEYPCSGFALGMDDKRLVYQLFDPEVYNVNHIYNNEKNIFEAFRFKVPGSLTLIDTNVIYSYIGYGLAAYKFDSTVFIEENGGQEETSIYPNPTTQNATIELKSIDIGKSWILSDVSGGLIRQGKIEAESSLNIDLAEFARGTYYITIIGANEQRTYKLIKL